ncbi:hypothetical protein Thpro_021283 [Acidihalobacter prosperus]|uniref:GGDEF domain-containing protein n=1 Tax=Acidihalobacter prosperus TaxID=160660 RepID=A0A1A6C6P7_9GAMM|nr:hypothetical protein Thpro_021283 [Acidihalobacter prosperus]
MAAEVLTVRKVILRISLIIVLVEGAIMLALAIVPLRIHSLTETLLDAALLGLISIPLIYLWVVRPFITAHDALLRQVTHLAYHDPLTRLPNRRLLADYLERALAGYRRSPAYGALLLVDLDGFKAINDNHGHEFGDIVLIVTAQRLLSATRREDLVSRLGGDEFVVLLHQLSPDAAIARVRAEEAARKLIRLVSEAIETRGVTVEIGASIGVRLLGPESVGSESAIRDADEAMYRVKAVGGGDVAVHEAVTSPPIR